MGAYLFGVILGAYVMADVHYYIRTFVTYVYAKLFRKRISITDPSEIYGIVLPTDADFMFTHMNNARYLREYDFARFDHGTRCGMIEMMFAKRGAVAAHTIRYRLPLMMFSAYKRIITLSDDIVRSVGYSKIATNFNVDQFVRETFPELQKPEIPEDMLKWLEFNILSSQKMKNYVESGMNGYKNGKCS